MTDFRSYIFEKTEPKKEFPISIVIGGLLIIMLLNHFLKFDNFWIHVICAALILILTHRLRFKGNKYGKKQDLNGYFTDEIKINESGIKISDRMYSIDKIRSIQIVYDNIYGSKDWNYNEANFKKNGETNLITFELIDNTLIKNNFKLASVEHARQLFQLTESLKKKVRIQNDWKLNYNA